ncbi:V-set and transmembrane domain-containing protein 4a isoform X1 [Corythoichthys intestinalis]|uniref:V-set and transmembrane domain-containing protein 4a isoform X1 n=1 Tax=Corythoichthys intestinalis TaxID=161448 RepID=UPI0025A4EB4E|nr:V-set and transmembrane domain-containing protein 4a isoform X1 [Corythoichthys intestinalis]
MYISVVLLVLTKVLLIEVCHALNVTVIPGPVVSATERDNLTLSCLVSQRKTSTSTLVLRWFFSPQTSHSPVHLLPPPSPSPTTAPESSQVLIVKMGIKKIKLYGNYTRGFSQPKFRLYEQIEGEAYRLVILNVSGTDRGFYTCRVHEIRKYRNIWRASSNGSSTTQLTVHFTLEARRGEGIWRLLSDVNVCAVLICSLGLLSIFLFTLTLTIQYFYRRHRLKASYLLVKCPESSSGETVTSTSSSSSSSPRPQNKYTKHQSDVKVALKPPKLPEDPPPQTPEKVPVASKRPQKPKRSKAPRRSQPRAHQEESLTYAELELVRPTVEPPASTCPDLEPSNPDTVYAQILFQEKQL